jgi:DNA (cytosine-5)-methyltransferase 1
MKALTEQENHSFTALDFFAGSGLVTHSLRPYFQVIWANDISGQKAEVYKHNHGSEHFHLADINTLTSDELPQVDLSWASFPCQDLSLAGYGEGIHARRSGLVWQWLNLMNTMEKSPDILVAENVEGLVSTSNGANYLALHQELSRMGYRAGAIHLNACKWLPQSRPRIFVVAIKKNINIPTQLTSEAASWLHTAAITQFAPALNDWIWWDMPKPSKRTESLSDLVDWDAPVDSDEKTQQLLAMLSDKHRDELATKDELAIPGYKRTRYGIQRLELRFDGIAGCLRTPKGGSSRQVLVLKSNGSIHTRLLTARETARLMGAPEDYWLPAGYNDAYMAMGDAVAVPAVHYLATHLLAPLAAAVQKQHEQEVSIDGPCRAII